MEPLCAFACVMQNFQAGVGDYAVEHVILVDVVEKFRAGIFGAAAGLMLRGIVNLERHHAQIKWRKVRGDCGALYAPGIVELFPQLLVKRDLTGLVAKALLRQVSAGDSDVLHREAERSRTEIQYASHQQARTRKQNNRQRHLCRNQKTR